MSNPALRADLTLNVSQFVSGIATGQKSLKQLDTEAKSTAGSIALLEQEIAALSKTGANTSAQVTRLEGMRKGYRELQTEIKNTTRQIRDLETASSKGASAHAEGGANHGQAAMLGHSTRATIEMMMAGQSPMQAVQVEAPRVIQAFGGGIGAIAAVGAISAIASKLMEARTEAKALQQELTALGAPMPTAGASSVETINERLKQTHETIKNLENAQGGFWHTLSGTLGNRLSHPFSGNLSSALAEQSAKDESNLNSATGERDLFTHRLAQRGAMDNALSARADAGDDSAALDAIRRKHAEERAEIETRASKGEISSSAELVANSKEREKQEIEVEQRKQKSAAQSIALERRLTDIKREGLQVDVQTAKAQLDAARDHLALHPDIQGNQRAALEQAIHAGEASVAAAEKATREKASQLELETRIANLRGSSDAIQKATLDAQRQDLLRKLNSPDTKPDELPGINLALAQNSQARTSFANSQREKNLQADVLHDQSQSGRGPLAQIALIDKELNRVAQRRINNHLFNSDDKLVAEQLNNAETELKKHKDDILFAEQQALEAAKSQTKEMQLQANGNTTLAGIEATRASYHERIVAALRDGKTELAAQLQIQQNLANEKARKAAYEMTPGQDNAERNRLTQEANANKRFQRDDGLKNISRDIDGNPIDGYDPALHARRRFGDHSSYADQVRQGSENAGKADKDGVDFTETNKLLDKIVTNTANMFKNRT